MGRENAAMTATVAAGPFQSLRQQLSKLRHLSQPFFLPLDQASGWQFLWLLVSLLFCVGGLVLAALTGIIRSLEQLQPALTEKYFGGVANTISGICLLYTSPSPRDGLLSRMPSSA